MKRRLFAAFVLSFALVLSACEYDNYAPPTSLLEGQVTYEGEALGVRQRAIDLELWETKDYALNDYIPLNLHQDGTFSAMLYSGDYQLVVKPDNGPWVGNTDTISVHVAESDNSVEVPVTPFFTIQNEEFTVSDTTITATVDIEQVVEDSELETVGLYIGSTQFVSSVNNISSTTMSGDAVTSMEGVELTVHVPPEEQDREYVFARVGVKTSGVGELIYTQVQQVEL